MCSSHPLRSRAHGRGIHVDLVNLKEFDYPYDNELVKYCSLVLRGARRE
jgi:hypothetical protein